MPRRRIKQSDDSPAPADYSADSLLTESHPPIDVRHVYDPKTNAFLGTLPVADVPADPEAAAAYAGTKAKANRPSQKTERQPDSDDQARQAEFASEDMKSARGDVHPGPPEGCAGAVATDDGWGQLRKEPWWAAAADSKFWKEMAHSFEALPDDFIADFSGFRASRGNFARSVSPEQRQVYQNEFERLAIVAVDKLTEVGFEALGSDPVKAWIGLLQSNRLYGRETTVIGRRKNEPFLTGQYREVNPRRTAMALCSTLATQALHNEVTARRKARPRTLKARRGYRIEVQQYMHQKGYETVEKAARALGVGASTLKSIMSSKGTKRYGEETLVRVLRKIGVISS